MKGIKETRELVAAVAALAIRTMDDLADGKISFAEGIAFVGDFGIVREGVQGISQVPAELADLDEAERDVLLADIKAALASAGLAHRIGDIAEEILRWAYSTVRTFVTLRSLPPAALAA